MAPSSDPLDDEDYARLLRFRTELRTFLRWSEEVAAAAGLTASQHQLLLAVRGHDAAAGTAGGPTIGDVAEYLLLKHHSAVELADRAEVAGLIKRVADRADRRVVRLRLTPRGTRLIEKLAARHLEELRRLAGAMAALARTS